MKRNRSTVKKLAFHTHKPKAARIASWFRAGARRLGYEVTITNRHTPIANHIGVFYGVVPETYAAWRFYKAEKRAVYLDNGWLSTPKNETLRFSWNSVQAFLQDMDPQSDYVDHPLPMINHTPVPGRALILSQSELYFQCMRLNYTLEQWERACTSLLEGKGYDVVVRRKPRYKTDPDEVPPPQTFFDQIAEAEIVMSLNSAACLKALRYGIPAFCTLDCTLSPLAPVRIPDRGFAAPPDPEAVDDMCRRLWDYEITPESIRSGVAIERILAVPENKRRGYFYAKD